MYLLGTNCILVHLFSRFLSCGFFLPHALFVINRGDLEKNDQLLQIFLKIFEWNRIALTIINSNHIKICLIYSSCCVKLFILFNKWMNEWMNEWVIKRIIIIRTILGLTQVKNNNNMSNSRLELIHNADLLSKQPKVKWKYSNKLNLITYHIYI